MRHRKAGVHLGMESSHRKALFRNLARSLVTYERIRTTEVRGKELRRVTDRLVTWALQNDLAARREAYKVLGSHQLVKKLFDEIGPRFVGVPGGFTRLVKMGMPRTGDNAPMVLVEFSLGAGESKAPKAEAPAAPAEEAKAG